MADYRNVVKKAVRKAFRQVGTLAQDIRFIAGQPSGFDFNNAAIVENSSTQLILKGIISETKKSKSDKDEANCITKTVTLIADDVPNLGSYDSIVAEGLSWKVIHPVENNGFVVTFNVTREM